MPSANQRLAAVINLPVIYRLQKRKLCGMGKPLSMKAVSDTFQKKHLDITKINQGLNLFEGDIVLHKGKERNTLIEEQSRWPRVIPYYLEDSLEINAKGVILKAFERFRLKTCINFQPWKGEKNYLSVFAGDGCYSYVGNLKIGKQPVSIGLGCDTVEIVQHEFLHALGFFHEQSRSDRDDYLTIMWNNISPDMANNFVSYNSSVTSFLNVPYDYISVMHYGKTAFSTNGDVTMMPKNSKYTEIMGKQMDFSSNDILKLNQMYNCTSTLAFLDSCSFDSDAMCAMLQATDDSTDWQLVTSASGEPSSDHTYLDKAKDIGYFMHFNTSAGNAGDTASLESRLFFPVRGVQCLEFFYYQSGSEDDELNIWLLEYTDVDPKGVAKLVSTIKGNSDSYWKIHHTQFYATNKFRYIFQGKKGSGVSTGGFSIDDINLSETECPENVWQIKTEELVNHNSLLSPPYYSKDGYAYQVQLYKSLGSIIMTLYLISGANDATLQWPCPWRQVTVEFLDQNPNAQQRTSNMKSITTDPNLILDGTLVWDDPRKVGFKTTFANGTEYYLTGTNGVYMFEVTEWFSVIEFLKGGSGFIFISMNDISNLTKSQTIPSPISTPTPKPELCEDNVCHNEGVCIMENSKPACRCKNSGSLWYGGELCEKKIASSGSLVTMPLSVIVLAALVTIIIF